MTGRALAVAVGEIRSECRGPNHSPGQRSGHRTHLHNKRTAHGDRKHRGPCAVPETAKAA